MKTIRFCMLCWLGFAASLQIVVAASPSSPASVQPTPQKITWKHRLVFKLI